MLITLLIFLGFVALLLVVAFIAADGIGEMAVVLVLVLLVVGVVQYFGIFDFMQLLQGI